jgi:KDO2-lipid IV(A) lauroyltransferase
MPPSVSEPAATLNADKEALILTRNSWYAPRWFDAAIWITGRLPTPVSRSLALLCGELGFRLCHNRREAVRRNLAALVPDEQEQWNTCRRCFHNFLRMLHDFCDSAERGARRVNELMTERRGFEFLKAARQVGRGTILVTGHLGAWELGGMVLASDGFPVNVVTLAEPTAELNAWRREYRERFGIKTITVGSDKFAFVEIIAALRRNELVAMLVDRPYLNSGVEVRFFDRSTSFSAAAARLWQHTGATVIPAFVLQLEPGSYGCYAYPSIDMRPDQSLRENSQLIADVFQSIIREFPDQWFNFVPIWNSQPHL